MLAVVCIPNTRVRTEPRIEKFRVEATLLVSKSKINMKLIADYDIFENLIHSENIYNHSTQNSIKNINTKLNKK